MIKENSNVKCYVFYVIYACQNGQRESEVYLTITAIIPIHSIQIHHPVSL